LAHEGLKVYQTLSLPGLRFTAGITKSFSLSNVVTAGALVALAELPSVSFFSIASRFTVPLITAVKHMVGAWLCYAFYKIIFKQFVFFKIITPLHFKFFFTMILFYIHIIIVFFCIINYSFIT
jgi:hypothetical protein